MARIGNAFELTRYEAPTLEWLGKSSQPDKTKGLTLKMESFG